MPGTTVDKHDWMICAEIEEIICAYWLFVRIGCAYWLFVRIGYLCVLVVRIGYLCVLVQ